jgi:hypothetical protein
VRVLRLERVHQPETRLNNPKSPMDSILSRRLIKVGILSRGSTGSADRTLTFLTTGAESALLPNSRKLSGTTNQITLTDGGAGGNLTLSLPQNIHTGAVPTFAGLTLNGTCSVNTGTLTLDGAAANLVSRYNAGGTLFTGVLKVSLTNSASAAGSLVVNVAVDSVSKWTLDPSGNVVQGGQLSVGGDVKFGTALVALGGGSAPTLGTIGGAGPATAAQNSWLKVLDSTGAACWLPVWK